MIKKLFLASLLLTLPAVAFADDGKFTARVDNSHIAPGEGFTLELGVSGASPRSDPDLSPLSSSFDVESQAATSETSIVNGHVSSTHGWQLELVPKQTGHVAIPVLSVDTDQGRLSTQPLELDVADAPRSSSTALTTGSHDGRDVSIEASVNRATPFQNQPVIYDLRIATHVDISDLSLSDVKADNAIVKPIGKPIVSDTIENGVPIKIIDVRYLVTPIRPGSLTLAPVTLRGSVESNPSALSLPTAQNGFIDPMAMLQQMEQFTGFTARKPFSAASNPVSIDVKTPVAGVDPWLPLKGLRIEDHTDYSQGVKVGEPISRKFSIIAEGMEGSQLPSLESQLQVGDIKIYADKPVTDDQIDPATGEIIGHREESYNVVPLKPGLITLPAVKLAWWDTKDDRISYAEVPPHKLDVVPGEVPVGGGPTASQTAVAPVTPQNDSLPLVEHEQGMRKTPWMWYGIDFLLFLIVFGLSAFGFNRFRRSKKGIARENNLKKDNGPSSRFVPAKVDIKWEQIHNPSELHQALQNYAHRKWDAPLNAPIESTLMFRRETLISSSDQTLLSSATSDLMAALYRNKEIDVDDLKSKFRSLLTALDAPAFSKRDVRENLPSLNPS